MNGRQVIDAARERDPRLPAVPITGYAGAAQTTDLEVVRKSFDPAALMGRVAARLEGAGAGPPP